MNDSPVDCQSRRGTERRSARPSRPTNAWGDYPQTISNPLGKTQSHALKNTIYNRAKIAIIENPPSMKEKNLPPFASRSDRLEWG